MVNNFDKIDIDQLHHYIIKDFWPRRSGKTLLCISNMVHEALLGGCGNNYIYIGTYQKDVDRVYVQTFMFMKNENIEVYKKNQNQLTVSKTNGPCQTFTFSSADNDVMTKFNGIRFDEIFLDIESYITHSNFLKNTLKENYLRRKDLEGIAYV